ncbi:MAG: hypothetical protein EOO27_07075 [Comamonadaceae bacterium]|nr:MAG: hypothetical protein EOO27_07075 [Comamonadaceae bacterium]
MSIMNWWTTPEKAIVAVDTRLGSLRNDTVADEGSKLLVLPHLGAVLAGRGVISLLGAVFQIVHAHGGDFDHVAQSIGPALKEQDSRFRQFAREGGHEYEGLQQLVFVGYSHSLGKLATYFYESDGSAVTMRGDCPRMFAPGDYQIDYQSIQASPFSEKSHLELARAQVAGAMCQGHTAGMGGRLVIAHVARDGVSTRVVGDI